RQILSEDATATVLALAAKYDLSFETLIIGSWALLLQNYSGEDNVDVALPDRSADPSGMAEGVLRLQLSIDPAVPLISWLRQVQMARGALTSAIPGHAPGKSSIEAMVLATSGPTELERELVVQSASSPLFVLVEVEDGMIRLALRYDRNHFDETAIHRVTRQLRTVLE